MAGQNRTVMKIVQLKDKDSYDEDVMLVSIPDGLESYTSLLETLYRQAIDESDDVLAWTELFEEKLQEHGIVRVWIDDTVYI